MIAGQGELGGALLDQSKFAQACGDVAAVAPIGAAVPPNPWEGLLQYQAPVAFEFQVSVAAGAGERHKDSNALAARVPRSGVDAVFMVDAAGPESAPPLPRPPTAP